MKKSEKPKFCKGCVSFEFDLVRTEESLTGHICGMEHFAS